MHGGRVVFADWLRGAGLLVILDHGNGYLSLYGHNQSLLKDAGDVVKAGEAIATVGNSGGQRPPRCISQFASRAGRLTRLNGAAHKDKCCDYLF